MQLALSSSRPLISLQDIFLGGVFFALLLLSSLVRVEIGPIPLTGQSFMVLLTPLVLTNPRVSLTVVIAYVGLALVPTLPFSAGDISRSGGYLLGFILASRFLTVFRPTPSKGFWHIWRRTALASGIIYVPGAIWLLLSGAPALGVLVSGVLVFVPGDLAKAALAAAIIARRNRS